MSMHLASYLDLIAVAISVCIIIAYYVFLSYKLARDPMYTTHSVHVKARYLWVMNVMKEGRDIMAIHTLRNFLMSATFKASSAILLIMGTLTLSSQVDSLAKAWHILNIGGSVSPEWWIVKIICMLTVLLVAFFSFAMVIRILNHVVFMINLPEAYGKGVLDAEHIAQRLNQAGVYYTIGMRAYFLTIPLVFWLFGALFLIASTVGLVTVLYFIDRSR